MERSLVYGRARVGGREAGVGEVMVDRLLEKWSPDRSVVYMNIRRFEKVVNHYRLSSKLMI